jgi:O-antigen ligase
VRRTFEGSSARKLLLWLCALKIAAVILAVDPAGLVAFQLPKALASRAIEWLTAAALAYALLRYSLRIVPRSRLHAFVAALGAVSLVSAIFAADRYLALFGDPENYAGLSFLLDMLVLYAALTVAVRRERDVAILLVALFGAGLLAMAYGAAQTLGLDPVSWAVDPTGGRAFATFGNPDHFGHFLSVVFGVALGTVVGVTRLGVRALALLGVILTAAIAAIVATRGTVLGMAGAILGIPFLRRTGRGPLVIGGGALLLLAAALAVTPLGQRTIATASGGTPDRVFLYEIAARATLARPILGYGPDNFRVAHAEHRTVASLAFGAGPYSTAHDWLLDASVSTGVVGLLVLCALMIVGTLELRRLATERPAIGAPLFMGWLAYWAHALVAAESMAASWYPWVALGTAAGLRGIRQADRPPRRVPHLAVAALAVVAAIGALSGARAFQANRDAWTSAEAAHFGDLSAATEFADRAAARDGGRADYWNRLGLAYEAEKRWPPAVAAYREAARRGPYVAVYWANLARGLARLAGSDPAAREEAVAAARQATLVDPNAPLGHVVLAEVAVAFGRCELAVAEATVASSLEIGHGPLVERARACR